MTGSRHLALGNTNITRLFAGIFQFHDGGPAKQIRISGLSCMYALTLKQLTDRTQQGVTWLCSDRARVMADELLTKIPNKVEAHE